ncbi:alpha/beta fold hydrolase [Lentzea sp. NPDC051213]|uniref:alpha/beta fold hydrolase n=1 Tax=Lentzea sp. NPDC051213 TaxID=3364126 RepID=UPI0037AA8822
MKLSSFANEKARRRYHEVYDELLDWPLPYEDITVETSFGPTYVRRSGNGTGEPLVLLHGLAATSLVWQEFVADIGSDHVLYAVDSMGEAGRSVQTKPIPDEQANADWLAEVLEGLGHEKYHLVGLSRGGWLALNQAIRSPERVSRVTALDPGGFVKNLNKGRLYLFIGLMAMLAPAFVRRRIKRESFLGIFVEPLLRKLVLAGLGFQMRFFIASYFSDDEVRAITVPTRVIIGTLTPAESVDDMRARIARLAPHIEIVPVALHHGFGLIESPFLREQVTASESYTA